MLGYIVPYMESSMSTFIIMGAASGRPYNNGAGASGARPTHVESTMAESENDSSMYGTICGPYMVHTWARYDPYMAH